MPIPGREFVHIHAVEDGETLAAIAERHGLREVHPIVQHPGNRTLFPDLAGVNPEFTPLSSDEFELLVVPWPPAALEAYVTECEEQRRQVTQDAARRIEILAEDEKELGKFQFRIDALAALATFGVGSVSGIRSLGDLHRARQGVLTTRDLSTLLFSMGRSRAGLASLGLPPPDPLEHDLSFYLRHAFGITTPSWWASIVVSRIEGDWDIFKFGPHAVGRKMAEETRQRAVERIEALDERIADARAQLEADFYELRPPLDL